MYVLNLAEDNRILSAWDVIEGQDYTGMPKVDTLPDGDVSDYLYVDGEYVYDPLPKEPEPDVQPSQLDMIEAQVTYTAMMTDTLLEV